MPKRIPIAKKREWLKEYEDGTPLSVLAKKAGTRLEVIKRGIHWAKDDRRSSQVKLEKLKIDYIRHQDLLIEVVEKICHTIEIPSFEIRNDLPRAIKGATIDKGDSKNPQILKFDFEQSSHWPRLEQHLGKNNRVITNINKLRSILIDIVQGQHDLAENCRSKLLSEVEKKDHLCVEAKDIINSRLDTLIKMISRAALSRDNDFIKRDLLSDGYKIQLGDKSVTSETPGMQTFVEYIKSTYKELAETDLISKINKRHKEAELLLFDIRTKAEAILLAGNVPGRCDICELLGM